MKKMRAKKMRAKITISEGAEVCFTGTLTAGNVRYNDDNAGVLKRDKLEKFHEDLFNIERDINDKASYRCHIELNDKKR